MTWILSAIAFAEPVEHRGGLGAQVDADSHLVLDLAIRHRDWQVALFTDTLDVRWTPRWDGGKAWIAARGEAGAAGLMISPWVDGAPAPQQALTAFYGGLEGGAQRYGPAGTYIGASGTARYYAFGGLPTTSIEVPAARPIFEARLTPGWWRPAGAIWVDLILVVAPDSPVEVVQPSLSSTAMLDPGWRVSPHLEVRAGWAHGQDRITLTRLGGINPYVVPLAGAAWAEFWVEDYAATRVGPALHTQPVTVAAVADLAWFDGQTGLGLALDTRARHGRWFAELEGGYTPDLPRQSGISRASVWVAVGWDWGTGSP